MKNENFNAGLAYAEYKQRQLAYIIAAITAFLMSAYFVVGYFAGHLRIMEWDGSQWAQAIPSLGLVGVMTAYQFFLYSQGDVDGGKKATWIAVAVAVAFSLLSEIGQGMERDSIRMEAKSLESPTYKALIASLGGAAVATYNPYSADLQAAEMKLAQCQERLSRGKEKHCEGSKARVEAVNKMIATGNASSQEKALALATTAKTMERDEKNYHPLVNFIREVFGAGGTVASFLLSLTLISFFEYAFHYLGGEFAKAREKLMQHGYDVTRKLRQPPRKHDGSVTTYSAGNATPALSALDSAKMTVGEYAQKVEEGLKASPEVIANEYARAQHAREQLYKTGADKLENIQSGLNQKANELDEPAIKMTEGFKQSPEQLDTVKRLHKEQMDDYRAGKTYRDELREGSQVFSDSPLDKPRPMSVEATVKQLQADVKASGATSPAAIQAAVFDSFAAMPNPAPLDDAVLVKIADKIVIKMAHAPARPASQKPGMTGLHNPVLGKSEEHFSLPLPEVGLPPLLEKVDLKKLAGQLGQGQLQVDLNTAEVDLNKRALMDDLEQKLAFERAEKANLQRQAEVERSTFEAEKGRLEKLAYEAAEQARIAAETRSNAERSTFEAEQGRREKLAYEAAEQARIAAEKAEQDRLQREAEAERQAELGQLTEQQVNLAAQAIKAAIESGQVNSLGRSTLKPVLAIAGLPRSTEQVKVLVKYGCTDLISTGLVSRNPKAGQGKGIAEFVINKVA